MPVLSLWSSSTRQCHRCTDRAPQLRHVRVEFKLCLLVYKPLNGLAPSYITDMLQPVTTLDRQVTLRSADNNDLFISRSHLRLVERAFRIAAPRAWSSLPSNDVVNVKTFLFPITLWCHLIVILFCVLYFLYILYCKQLVTLL